MKAKNNVILRILTNESEKIAREVSQEVTQTEIHCAYSQPSLSEACAFRSQSPRYLCPAERETFSDSWSRGTWTLGPCAANPIWRLKMVPLTTKFDHSETNN